VAQLFEASAILRLGEPQSKIASIVILLVEMLNHTFIALLAS
jgi:hypothetical protein